MTPTPAPARSGERTLHLVVAKAGPPPLERHPNEGSTLADPYQLGPAAARSLRAVVLALCPPGPAPRSPELMERVATGARRLFRYMHPVVAGVLAVGLVVIDWLPIFTSFTRLSRLDPSRASVVLGRWSTSRLAPLRLLVTGLRSAVQSVYFDQDEVHRAIGYAPVPFIRERILLRQKLLAPMPLAAE